MSDVIAKAIQGHALQQRRALLDELKRLGREAFGGDREPSEDELERLGVVALKLSASKAAAEVIAQKLVGAKAN